MKNVWSDNKYINITIYVLLFLLGMNFLHFSQIVIPVICLILFIDNKFVFKVNNIKTFVILCLFGLSFLFFARKQGLFAFIGLFVPMAYYVGSNIKEVNEENIKEIIYVIVFGMMMHVLLNFGLDLYRRGFRIFFSTSHYDIWTLADMSETATSINYVFLYGVIYYVLFHEKNKNIKIITILFFVLSSFYCVALGERTTIIVLLISLVISLLLDCLIFKTLKLNKKIIITISSTVSIVSIVVLILYIFNRIDDYNYTIFDMRLFGKFINKGFRTERLDILIETIRNAPQHLWGNNEISLIVGLMPHDLWLDVYDIAGLMPFLLLCIHTIIYINTFIKVIKSRRVSKEFKLFIIPLFICILLQMLLEPIMSGSSVFLLVVIIVETLIEKLYIYEH